MPAPTGSPAARDVTPRTRLRSRPTRRRSMKTSVPPTGSASTVIVAAGQEAALEQRPRERVLDQPLDRRA